MQYWWQQITAPKQPEPSELSGPNADLVERGPGHPWMEPDSVRAAREARPSRPSTMDVVIAATLVLFVLAVIAALPLLLLSAF